MAFSILYARCSFCEYGRGGLHHVNRTTTAHPSIRSHLTVACLWHLCLFRHGVHGGSTAEGRVLYRCTSKQRHDHRTASAHPSIRSHLTEACPRQLCLFRHGVHGGGTAEAKCQMYIQSASWRSLHHNTRLTSRIEYGKCHYYLEKDTISIYTRSKPLVFPILSLTC